MNNFTQTFCRSTWLWSGSLAFEPKLFLLIIDQPYFHTFRVLRYTRGGSWIQSTAQHACAAENTVTITVCFVSLRRFAVPYSFRWHLSAPNAEHQGRRGQTRLQGAPSTCSTRCNCWPKKAHWEPCGLLAIWINVSSATRYMKQTSPAPLVSVACWKALLPSVVDRN